MTFSRIVVINITVIGVLLSPLYSSAQYGYDISAPGTVVKKLDRLVPPARKYTLSGAEGRTLSESELLSRFGCDLVVIAQVESVDGQCFSIDRGRLVEYDGELQIGVVVLKRLKGFAPLSRLTVTAIHAPIRGCVEYPESPAPEEVHPGEAYLIAANYNEAKKTWSTDAGLLIRYEGGAYSRCRTGFVFGDYSPERVLEEESKRADLERLAGTADVIALVEADTGAVYPDGLQQVRVLQVLKGNPASVDNYVPISIASISAHSAGLVAGRRVLVMLTGLGGTYRLVDDKYGMYYVGGIERVPDGDGGHLSLTDYIRYLVGGK